MCLFADLRVELALRRRRRSRRRGRTVASAQIKLLRPLQRHYLYFRLYFVSVKLSPLSKAKEAHHAIGDKSAEIAKLVVVVIL